MQRLELLRNDELLLSEQLCGKGFKLTTTKEGTFSEFLGIEYSSDNDGSIHLSQEGLIKKILSTTGLEEGQANPNKLPAKYEPLGWYDAGSQQLLTIGRVLELSQCCWNVALVLCYQDLS